MKKSTKIFSILLVSLITLISVVCVTAFATEAEATLDVTLNKNICVSDKIQAMYAVKADENITAENTTLTVYDKDPEAEGAQVVWSGYGVEENLVQFGGDKYIVFYTNRVALFGMAETFYVQFESDGVKSAVESYSVAEYLFDKLYKDDFVNKTEADGEDYSRKLFYEGLVQTGAAAYTVIDDHNAEKSIADLAYVYVDGATLADGSVKAVVDKGNSVELGTLPAGYKWAITSYTNGAAETVETKESTLTLDANKVVTLVSDLYYTNPAYPDSYKYSYDEYTELSTDNLVLQNPNYNDGISVTNGTVSLYNRQFALKNSGATTGTTYIFETDLYIDNSTTTATSGLIGQFGLAANASDSANRKMSYTFASFNLSYTADESGNVTRVYISEQGAPESVIYAELALDTWQNIRIEYTPTGDTETGTYTGTVKFYLNGELTKEYVTSGYNSAAADVNTSFECFVTNFVGKSSSGYGNGKIYMDNTFMSAIGE